MSLRVVAFFLLTFCAILAAQSGPPVAARVQGVRFWTFGDVTRVAIETTGGYKLYSEQIEKPNRIFFDLMGLEAPAAAQRNMQVIQVGDNRIRQIRVARLTGSKTRIVIDLENPAVVTSSQLVNPDRLMIEVRPKDISPPVITASKSVNSSSRIDLSSQTRPLDPDIAETQAVPANVSATTVPLKTHALSPSSDKPRRNPAPREDPDDAYHPVRHRSEVTKATIPPEVPAIAAPPTPEPITEAEINIPADRSLVRVFGLKLGRVVIDAGHGGHDSGTIGPNGLMEKDLVLDVALRLGKLITKQMGAEVIYTRSSDVFIPLEQRTKVANDQKADLFISVHANSSPEPSATGVETYYFNLTSDKGGLDLATRENSTADSSISDLSDLLHRAVLQTKREESREFAQRVQTSLFSASLKTNNHGRDRGVRPAPFVVLIGATMPSILAEIGFVSNPRDERLMRRSDQRQKIAEALFKGVAQYSSSLSHVQMARADN